tara:strand:- start:49 stop:933 length:885 start_codon:yes stop_codon:yes gene_type:complete
MTRSVSEPDGHHAIRGAGLGLRIPHIPWVLENQPHVNWFEVHICNYLGGGLNRTLLQEISRTYPLSFHGVSLNLGGCDPLDPNYLNKLRLATEEFRPTLISEHACLTAHNGEHFHDLIPVPFTRTAARHMAARIRQVQDTLGRRILIENLSRYARYEESELTEAEFLTIVCELADCGLLLDINNAYVNQLNLGESWRQFVRELPLDRIGEIHLAGHSQQASAVIDTHSQPVCDGVWDAYRDTVTQFGTNIPVLIEWDNDLPPFTRLLEECNKAALINDQTGIRPLGAGHVRRGF